MISGVFGVLGWKVAPFAPDTKTTVITVWNWWNFHPVSPQNGNFLPKTRNPTILGDFNENHLKWVDFSEKYRSGRKKHLKRPKMDCVFLLLRVNSGFSPPEHQKSPNFTTFHQKWWNSAKFSENQWIPPFWLPKYPNGLRTMQKGIWTAAVFFTSGAEGCFRVDFTWIPHFSIKIMMFMKNCGIP